MSLKVIKSPILSDVLVSPLRTATRLTELSDEETCYLFVMAKHVQKMLESIYGIGKVTQFIVEDEGPHAVQAVKYVHVHVLPRMDNDFGNNLDLAVLQGREGQGEARSVDEMESEATRYRQWLQKKSDEGWNE
uniref:HIT domain-containing protein n=1 Tax=Globodera pallida TaxID=36090 RepID=A0A183C025_GLOPA